MNEKNIRKIADSSKQAKHIIKLLKNRQYNRIFELYGQDMYFLVVPKKIQNKDIKQLLKDGKFEDIYTKYGRATYNGLINKMESIEIYDATGSKLKKFFNRLKPTFKIIGLGLMLTPSVYLGMNMYISTTTIQSNMKKYEKELDNYNKENENYAKQIKSMNLTDIQIITKLMNDIWKKNSYGQPKNEKFGLNRLALYESNVGVCRNMADDFTAKINEINPKYNAHNICVNLEKTDNDGNNIKFNVADIDRHISKQQKNTEQEEKKDIDEIITNNLIGNHMVTALNIPNKDITLIVDPTNPGIGIYKNGKIYMFSTEKENGISKRFLGDILWTGKIGIVEEDLIDSFKNPDESLEELKKEYGTDAINEALKVVREKDKEYSELVQGKQNETLESSIENTITQDKKLTEFNKNYKIKIDSNVNYQRNNKIINKENGSQSSNEENKDKSSNDNHEIER